MANIIQLPASDFTGTAAHIRIPENMRDNANAFGYTTNNHCVTGTKPLVNHRNS